MRYIIVAKRVPGKEEFHETLRYFNKQLQLTGVDVKLGTAATAQDLAGFDAVVIATGVVPRDIKLKTKTDKINVLPCVFYQ